MPPLAVVTILLLAGSHTGRAWSQTPAPATPGDRLWVRAPSLAGGHAQGVLREVTATELVLTVDGAQADTRLPLAGLTELRRSAGTKRHLLGGLLAGSLSGAITGGSAGGAAPGAERTRAQLGAVVGGALGGVLGYLRPTARWDRLSLRTVRPDLLPGMRVRVSGEGLPGPQRFEGVLANVTPDSVVFVPNSGAAVRLARSSIRSVEWPVRQQRATVKGLAIGGGIGLVGGAAVGFASGDDCTGWLCFNPGEMALFAGAVFGALGAMAGGTIGSVSHVTVWESEQRKGPVLTIAPSVTVRRLGLVASVSF